MTISSETLQALRSLAENTPALLARLRQASNAPQTARILTQAASHAGLDVNEKDLCDFLEDCSRQVTGVDLNDDQLATVAGGMTKEGFIAMSVFSLGIGCHIMSHNRNTSTGDIPERGQHYMSPEFCLSKRRFS